MKPSQSIILVVIAIGLAFFGCKKEGSAKIETSVWKVPSPAPNHRSKPPPTKRSKRSKTDYSTAAAELRSLASNVKLTDSQKQAVNDMIAQVQKALSEGVTKAAEGADKAIGDAKKAIGQ
jgi:hypothetical protein